MVRYTLKDISLFFKSSCCVKTEIKEPSPCKKAPQPGSHKTHHTTAKEYFGTLVNYQPLYATTITIGNRYVGSMSYHEQYDYFCKLIKQGRPYHGDIRYIYHFELNRNGQLHAHGIETGGYAANFHNAFGILGKHNTSEKAYVKVVPCNLQKYMEYINKENIKPMLTNIRQLDVLKLKIFVKTKTERE